MDTDLSADQEAEAQRIYDALKHSTDADLKGLARLLASKADGEIFGATEFAVRDAVHRIGAKAIETALDGRKKGVRRLQPGLPRLPRGGQVPEAAGQDGAERPGAGAADARLLPLPALPLRPLSLGRRPAADGGRPDAGGGGDGQPGRPVEQLRRGVREGVAAAGRPAPGRIDGGADDRGGRRALGARLSAGETFGAKTDWRWHQDARGRTCAYVSVDATGVGMQGDHGAAAEGRMAAVGLIVNPPPGEATGGVEQSRALAALGPLAGLGEPMRRQGAQLGMDRADVLGGVDRRRGRAGGVLARVFPRAECVLDFYHAAEHVNGLAKALYPGDEAKAGEAASAWCHVRKHEGGPALLAALEALELRGRKAKARKAHRQVSGYVRNNVHRMDYPRYRDDGWLIGSGHVEAACKAVVGQRLKGNGMRWSEPGADAVGHLRALFKSEKGQWDAFWANAA